ncbi:hypothetical protein Tco_1013109 [Tanacetum coccineum]
MLFGMKLRLILAYVNADAEVTLGDETQEMNDDNLMFDTGVLQEQEKEVAKQEVIAADPVTTAGEVAKDKRKVKMVEPEKPLKKKDQIAMDEEVARNLEAQLQAELEEEERISRLNWIQHNQLKSKSYDKIHEMFDKEMKRKYDEHVEAKKDDDQEDAEMKKHIEIVKDYEVAIDAIPLATKPPGIVKYKIVIEGKFVYFQLIKANGSSKRYLSMIKMLQNNDREDLETLWKLVKAKHGNTRLEEKIMKSESECV